MSERMTVCHAPGDRCLGCDHYYGRSNVCKYADSRPTDHDGQVRKMVDRFLAWPLPETFSPDAGVSFTAPDPNHWPTGTNLLTATEAEQMVRHMLAGEPALTDHADLIRRARDMSEGPARLRPGADLIRELANALEQQSPQPSAEATDLQYPIRKLREWLAFRRENNSDGINSTTRAVSQSMAYILLRDHGQTILDALEQRDGLRERVEWVIRDMSYKAPEQAADLKDVWAQKLLEALRGKED